MSHPEVRRWRGIGDLGDRNGALVQLPLPYSRQLARRLRTGLGRSGLAVIGGEADAGAWVYRVPASRIALTKAIDPVKEVCGPVRLKHR